MIQTLQGVKITPKGNNNRFSAQNWPNSYAFGAWIYNTSVNIGFSNKPNEIKMSLVLETSTFSQSAAAFDISQADLHCDAGNGGLANETWFDINIEGLIFSNYLLYSYDFSIEAGQKILNVTFKDYSIILDKIYVGLFKKQGYLYPHMVNCQLTLPIRCQDCEYTGSSVVGTGYAYRDISFGSYVGTNGNTYDLFSNSYYTQSDVFQQWGNYIIKPSQTGLLISQFDLNGGYLILGTEAATEERCNSAPDIKYSFIELISSLRLNGLNFSGAFPLSTTDSDFVYRNNHIGSLREVMQNWCSDLGYDFYCSGRTFLGINLKNPIDITNLTTIADPTSAIGQYFQINSSNANTAILSFNSKTSLDNTFRQSVVVENSYPITEKDVSKTVQRYVGITPLHPISLNQINIAQMSDVNVYGTPFQRPQYEISEFDPTYDFYSSNQLLPKGAKTPPRYTSNFSRLDGRSYNDVDAAIALSNYNDTLRDIYVAQRALRNVSGSAILANPYCLANFNALGIFPILEIDSEEMKSNIVEDYFQNIEKDGVQNLNIDQQYFRVFLGYYYSDFKNDIVNWEKEAASAMYKYGIVTKGILNKFPYVPFNILNDISPTAGFYGSNGLIYSRLQNRFTPDIKQYPSVQNTPFLSTLLYSGYVKTASTGVYPYNNPNYPTFIPPGFSDYPGRLPTGLWVGAIDNDWGTIKQDFDRALSLNLNDPCASQYSLDSSVGQILTQSDRNFQDWKLEHFLPIINSDLSKISEYVWGDELNIGNVVDEVITTYTDTHFIKKHECKKLHIIIIPDTTIHPNVNINFSSNPVGKINNVVLQKYKNKLYEADLRKFTTQTPSICSISLLDEMCRNLFTGGKSYSYQFSPSLTNQQSGCVLLEDKNNYFLEGFQKKTLFSANSRSLDITITKNPNNSKGPFIASDINGDYYYSDLQEGFLVVETSTANVEIVYPIQSIQLANNGANSANYSGIYETEVTTQYRIPAFTNIYGTPPNLKNNNTTSFKLINNTVDNTLNPILDPLTNQVKSYMTVLDGNGNSIINTPQAYYNYVQNLNNYNLTSPMKEITMSLAGPPSQFGSFVNYLNPSSGLQSITLNVSDNGVKTDLIFADRPKVLPKQEVLLNKIGPRIKGVYN
jgi:hypothetical protein